MKRCIDCKHFLPGCDMLFIVDRCAASPETDIVTPEQYKYGHGSGRSALKLASVSRMHGPCGDGAVLFEPGRAHASLFEKVRSWVQ